jgi:hypothetical protein
VSSYVDPSGVKPPSRPGPDFGRPDGRSQNDISQQMPNIAQAMTPQEIDEAAAYYASQPPEIVMTTD